MTKLIQALDLPTGDFSLWAQYGGAPLPVPLTLSNITRHPVDISLLSNAAADQIESPSTWRNPFEENADAPTRAMLAFTRRVLSQPSFSVCARRMVRSEPPQEMTAIGFARGDDGLVLVDTEQTVRLVRVPSTELSRAVIEALPPMENPATVASRQLAATDLEAVGALLSNPGDLARVAAAHGIPLAQAEVWLRVMAHETSFIIIDAWRYRDDELPVPTTALAGVVSCSPHGSLISRDAGTAGQVIVEPATRDAMIKSAVRAVAGLPTAAKVQ